VVAPRRQAVVTGLEECPTGKWVRIEDLFRLLQASDKPFAVARNLLIADCGLRIAD
jgi:hypothetical protein